MSTIMNITTDESKLTEPVSSSYLWISVFLFTVVLLIIWWLYYYRQGLRRRAWDRYRDSDDEQPFIERPTGRQAGFLVKRCDQTSTRNVEERIISRVRQQTQVCPWDRAQDDGHRPVIVFCVISSRIGTDIENAMRGVHGNSRVILVLLHCVLSSLLRGDLSDEEELLDPTMINRMAGIAHFAFSDREGLYHCQQNTVGFELLSVLVKSIG